MGSGDSQSDPHREGKIHFPIAAKLVTIITILVLFSLGTITALVTLYVSDDVQRTAEENNRTVNTRSAIAAETELSTIRSNVFLLLDMINTAGSSGSLSRQASAFFFERNQNISTIYLSNASGATQPSEYVNNRFLLANEIDGGGFDSTCRIRRSVSAQCLSLFFYSHDGVALSLAGMGLLTGCCNSVIH